MVKHSQIFIDSLIHPKKLAAYRLLTIGKTIQYVFILIAIVTVYSFYQFLTGVTETSYNIQGLTEYVEDIQWLLYPFAFVLLTLTSTIVLFIRISIYAFVGIIVLKIMNRRGEYRHLWRTAALAITWSTLLTVLFSLIRLSSIVSTIIEIIITMVILILASTKYPKIAKK
ncbi:DUF1189 family protein [Ureibacillus sinduriensis]|uniref:4-hydroxy-3-methylbut-2-en-1-yl diphosphate synthase n=1 Tax=Ureibacillus sinduriensis BLB-1 = JCM 15800 TaxID=1384057 RepID=A0A0A3II94_9BACL|nr:DUF1189 family protein [Ureibacillus sinduriensis]KGR74577.1 4-hydroxy-3-methylbut-2-en-1-yl diphosphate synthase [Ureibacillus sinduriensis BLB-1 = JCM 15800]